MSIESAEITKRSQTILMKSALFQMPTLSGARIAQNKATRGRDPSDMPLLRTVSNWNLQKQTHFMPIDLGLS
jgi:hypothetical protein